MTSNLCCIGDGDGVFHGVQCVLFCERSLANVLACRIIFQVRDYELSVSYTAETDTLDGRPHLEGFSKLKQFLTYTHIYF